MNTNCPTGGVVSVSQNVTTFSVLARFLNDVAMSSGAGELALKVSSKCVFVSPVKP